LGKFVGEFDRFPPLLKFLDAHEMLSVQVHPSEANADLLPAGETAKSEAWVVLDAGKNSRIYGGLRRIQCLLPGLQKLPAFWCA